jgi:hypothetical protein
MSRTHEFVAMILYAVPGAKEMTHKAHRFTAANNTAAMDTAREWARSRLTRPERMRLQVTRDGVTIANLSQESI